MFREISGAVGRYSALRADTKSLDKAPGSICYETDTGNVFELLGGSWVVIGVGGAAKVDTNHSLSSAVQYKEIFANVVGAKEVLEFTNSQAWTEVTILATSNVATLSDDIIGMVIINGDDIIEDAVFNGGVVQGSNGAVDVHYIIPNEPTIIPVTNEIIRRVAIISGRGVSAAQGLNFNITVGKYE